jgi:hypothetical protein
MIEAPHPDKPRGKVLCVGPVKDFDALVSQIDFGTVVSKEKARGDINVEITRPERPVGGSAEGVAAEDPEAKAKFEAEMEKHRQEAEARQKEFEKLARGPDPKAPDYHQQLAELLKEEHAPHHREAVKALLEMHPSDVADKETRAKIARGFKELALSTHFEKRDACRGLVIWGGKYSVPILVQMLDENKLGDNGPVFDALADMPTAEGATAAARYLGEFFNHDKAASAIRRMGAIAEEALIQVAPSDDEKVSLAAVALLGDVGTEKSYTLLRQAARSRNPAVKDAALASIRQIRTREQAAKAAAKPAAK